MGSGLGSSVRIHKEGTAGTKSTGAGYIEVPFTSESMNQVGKRASANNITSNRSRAATFFTGFDIGGSINGAITYENLDPFLYAICGSVATTGAGTDKTNIFTFANWSATYPSFSIEVSKGDVPTGKVHSFIGSYCTGLTLNFSASGESTFSANWISKDLTTPDDPEATTALVATDICILPTECTIDVGTGAAACVRSAQVTIDAPYANDRPCMGSWTAKMPLPNGIPTVSGNFVLEFADLDAYAAFDAGTAQSGGYIKYEGPIFTGAVTYKLECYINKFYYTQCLGVVDGPGVVLATYGWEAEGTAGSSTTSEPIAFKTVNVLDGDSVL